MMELGLGTVQFGLDYGVSNGSGRTPEEEACRILDLAGKNGIRILDTAAAYGDSETVIGRYLPSGHPFRLITKTVSLQSIATGEDPGRIVREEFLRSLDRLGQNSIYALLVHHAADLLGRSGEAVWSELAKVKAEGRVQRIGVSVYEGVESDEVLSRFPIDIIQLPLNVLDQRLIKGGQLQRLKNHGIEIHVRSVFLQGLLLMNPALAPEFFRPVRRHLMEWQHFIQAQGLTPSMAALSFIRARPEVDVVVLGVNDAAQLRTNIEEFSICENIHFDFSSFALDDPRFVNPAKWRLAA